MQCIYIFKLLSMKCLSCQSECNKHGTIEKNIADFYVCNTCSDGFFYCIPCSGLFCYVSKKKYARHITTTGHKRNVI